MTFERVGRSLPLAADFWPFAGAGFLPGRCPKLVCWAFSSLRHDSAKSIRSKASALQDGRLCHMGTLARLAGKQHPAQPAFVTRIGCVAFERLNRARLRPIDGLESPGCSRIGRWGWGRQHAERSNRALTRPSATLSRNTGRGLTKSTTASWLRRRMAARPWVRD